MPLTIYGRNLYLNRVLRSGDPATVYVALTDTRPDELTDGSSIAEPVGNAYARVAVANNAANWTQAADGVQSNLTSITFPTATGNWGTMRYFAICTASSGGQVIGWGGITSRRVLSGTTLRFRPHAITITNRETLT